MLNKSRVLHAILLLTFCTPYAVLVFLSLGTGWTFPNFLPDRMDFAAWRHFIANRDGLIAAFANSLLMSISVSIPSTSLGLVAGRSLRRCGSFVWHFVAYFPFVVSPVIVGICLYDVQVRLGIASTLSGVILAQFLFAFAFATIFFCEMWSPRIDRAEQLVATLGGNQFAIWRHAILPQTSGLIAVCLVQTALFSWLDYGLVSVLGGGNVRSLTLMLFSYIREASVNQAAQSGLVLLVVPILGSSVSAVLLIRARHRDRVTA